MCNLFALATLVVLASVGDARAAIRQLDPTAVTSVGERRILVHYAPSAGGAADGYRVYFLRLGSGQAQEELVNVHDPLFPSRSSQLAFFAVDPHVAYRVEVTAWRFDAQELLESERSNAFVLAALPIQTSPPVDDPAVDPPAPDAPPQPNPPSDPPSTGGGGEPPVAPTWPQVTRPDTRLRHWWRLGSDPAQLGRDFGNAAQTSPLSPRNLESQDVESTASGAYVKLDGVDERFEGPIEWPLTATDRFTLALWLRPGLLDREMTLFHAHDAIEPGRNEIVLSLRGDQPGRPLELRASGLDGSPLLSRRYPAPFVNGRFSHVALLYASGQVSVEVDGRPVEPEGGGPVATALIGASARSAAIGSAFGGAHAFEGAVQSLALWNDVLSPNERLAIYNGGDFDFELNGLILQPPYDLEAYDPDPLLQHWWRLGRDLDRPGRDFGNGAKRIELLAAVTPIGEPDVTLGALGAFLNFDGVEQWLQSPPAQQLGVSSRWTLGVWMRPAELTRRMRVFSTATGASDTTNAIRLDLRGDEPGAPLMVSAYDGGGRLIIERRFPASIQTGSFSFVVASYDAGALQLSVDGVPIAALVPPPPSGPPAIHGEMEAGPRRVAIGAGLDGGLAFRGALHSVALWSKTLTPQEVEAHRTAGAQELELAP